VKAVSPVPRLEVDMNPYPVAALLEAAAAAVAVVDELVHSQVVAVEAAATQQVAPYTATPPQIPPESKASQAPHSGTAM
jgi:hypothetical protein